MKGVSCWFPQSLKRESSNYPQRRVKASDKLGLGIDPLREKVRLQRYPQGSRQGTMPGPSPKVGSKPMPATSRRRRPREYQPDAGFRVRRKNMPYSLVTAEITIPPQVMDFILSRVTKILRLSGREVMLFRELRSL